MISLTQRKHWWQAAVVSLGLMAACALQAAEHETPTAAPMDGGGNMTPIESVDNNAIEGSAGEGKRMCKSHKQGVAKGSMKECQEAMANQLKLDDKQRELFVKAMKHMRDCKHGGKDLHEQLKTVVESDQYDEKKVRDIVRKHSAELEEQAVASSNALHAFYQSLGPWQKGKFKAIKDEMHGKMKESMKCHMKNKMGADMSADGAPAAAEEGAEHSHDHSGKTE
jgi:Spy/CpxP family protein refolding chaperone